MRQFQLAFDDDPQASLPALESKTILEGLNPVQQKAAATLEGPVMIVAGPGSGKTRTLTHRIAYLIATKTCRPHQILALTFTNKAAREMRERVEELVGSDRARGMWMGTFHSIFARMLRVEAEHLGFTRDFTIYDTDDTERIIRNLMQGMALDTKQFNPRGIRSLISSAKNQMVAPSAYGRMAATRMQDVASRIYGPYVEVLRKANALDFDDLLIKLSSCSAIIKRYSKNTRIDGSTSISMSTRIPTMPSTRLRGSWPANTKTCVWWGMMRRVFTLFAGPILGISCRFSAIIPVPKPFGLSKAIGLPKKFSSLLIRLSGKTPTSWTSRCGPRTMKAIRYY